MMEKLPALNSLIDGEKAYTIGEWDGQFPCHWHTSKMVLRPFKEEKRDGISRRKAVPFLKYSQETIYKPMLKRAKGPISLDDLNPKGSGKKISNMQHSQQNLYGRRSLQELHKESQSLREDEKYRNTKQFLDYKYKETEEYSVDKVMNRKKPILQLDERRNKMPIIAPGDKLYRNVDYSQDFYKDGGLVIGSTMSARYNKTVGKKANNFYDTLDMSVSTLNPKKLWNNKIYDEDQTFDKGYVKGLNNWEVNYLGLIKVSKDLKDDKKKLIRGSIKQAKPLPIKRK